MEEDRMQDHTHDLGPLFGTYLLRLPEVILKYMDPVSHPCLPFLYPVFPVSHVSNMGKVANFDISIDKKYRNSKLSVAIIVTCFLLLLPTSMTCNQR